MRWTVNCSIGAVALIVAAAAPALAQAGSFIGIVTRDTLGVPVPHAEVRLPALNRSAETNAAGEFRFNDLPAGRYLVAVRAIGFQTFADSIDVRPGRALDAELTLTPSVTHLDTLLTTARATQPILNIGYKDFEDRRAAHIVGSFLSDSALRANDNLRMASLLSMLPGVRAVLGGTTQVYLATGKNVGDGRPVFFAGSTPCFMTVFVDGVKIFENNSTMERPNFAEMKTSDYAGVEVYTSSATTPAQFSVTGSSCGTILLWRRSQLP